MVIQNLGGGACAQSMVVRNLGGGAYAQSMVVRKYGGRAYAQSMVVRNLGGSTELFTLNSLLLKDDDIDLLIKVAEVTEDNLFIKWTGRSQKACCIAECQAVDAQMQKCSNTMQHSANSILFS